MDYTHTFQVMINGTAMEGDLCFDKSCIAHYKTEDPIEMTVQCMNRLNHAFTAIFECQEAFGALKKFTIEQKGE